MVLLINDLFLVVPFVRGQYELFLAMLWKVRYFWCCQLLLRIMSFLVMHYSALLVVPGAHLARRVLAVLGACVGYM